MFTSARWRLTLWFAAALALILAVVGPAIYFTTRAVLMDQVDDNLRSRADQELRVLGPRIVGRGPRGELLRDVVIGPAFTAGGYFYALVDRENNLLGSTASVDPSGLARRSTVEQALIGGATFENTDSSTGEDLRVYVLPLPEGPLSGLVLEVGRSIEPEREALRRLIFILVAGGVAGLGLAVVGGFLLAGRALRPIRKAVDSQRAFVADASHELRTPLSLIRANAELLERHPRKTVRANKAAVDDIISETDRLSTLVSQMLTLAKADAGGAPFTVADIALHELVEDVGRQARVLADKKELQLNVQVDGPAVVSGDEVRLRELLLILLDNAIKFTVSTGTVSLTLASQKGRAVVQVSDSGSGIPPEDLPHIFDRFYRVDKARSHAQGGAGLGLAIAKWIVEGHGGSIRVDSQADEGTTFTIELPAR
jgi:two-component system sensor histidine kinase CiaH